MEAGGDSNVGRRFTPLRSVRRGLKAACRWTIGLGRGRPAAPGRRAGRRGQGRRGTPPLASLSAAMLDQTDHMYMENDT